MFTSLTNRRLYFSPGKIFRAVLRPPYEGTTGGGEKQPPVNPFPSRRDGSPARLKIAILCCGNGLNNVRDSSSRGSVTRNDSPRVFLPEKFIRAVLRRDGILIFPFQNKQIPVPLLGITTNFGSQCFEARFLNQQFMPARRNRIGHERRKTERIVIQE